MPSAMYLGDGINSSETVHLNTVACPLRKDEAQNGISIDQSCSKHRTFSQSCGFLNQNPYFVFLLRLHGTKKHLPDDPDYGGCKHQLIAMDSVIRLIHF